MDIAHLKTFLEIYRIRHFGKAADKLCVTQSAASARIKQLEERLGVSLFTRNKQGVEPTAAGHRFYKYAEVAVSGWERARQIVALPESYVQDLAIGCVPDSWHLFLAQHIDVLQNQLADTAFNLTIHPATQLPGLLFDGSLDLGLVFEPVTSPLLTAIKISNLDLQLYANYPDASLDQALGAGYVMVDWGALFEYEHSRAFSHVSRAAIRTNSGLMAIDLLRSGRRSAYLPMQEVLPDTGVELYPVPDTPLFASQLFAVFRHDSERSGLIMQALAAITASSI